MNEEENDPQIGEGESSDMSEYMLLDPFAVELSQSENMSGMHGASLDARTARGSSTSANTVRFGRETNTGNSLMRDNGVIYRNSASIGQQSASVLQSAGDGLAAQNSDLENSGIAFSPPQASITGVSTGSSNDISRTLLMGSRRPRSRGGIDATLYCHPSTTGKRRRNVSRNASWKDSNAGKNSLSQIFGNVPGTADRPSFSHTFSFDYYDELADRMDDLESRLTKKARITVDQLRDVADTLDADDSSEMQSEGDNEYRELDEFKDKEPSATTTTTTGAWDQLYDRSEAARKEVSQIRQFGEKLDTLGNRIWNIIPEYRILPESLQLIRPIGKGRFGQVYESRWAPDAKSKGKRVARKKDEETIVAAVKILSVSDDSIDEGKILEYVETHRKNHPNILEFYGWGEGHLNTSTHTDMNRYIYLVTSKEYASLGQIVRAPNHSKIFNSESNHALNFVRYLVKGIAAGMHHLHSEGIVHRDLKCDNVLVSQFFEPRIADFGLSAILDLHVSTKKANSGLGSNFTNGGFDSVHLNTSSTPISIVQEPCAPETVKTIIAGGKPTPDQKSDVYAMGNLIWELNSGKKPLTVIPEHCRIPRGISLTESEPPSENGYTDLNSSLISGLDLHPSVAYRLPLSSLWTEFHSIVEVCWKGDPKSRPSFREIVEWCHKYGTEPPNQNDTNFLLQMAQ